MYRVSLILLFFISILNISSYGQKQSHYKLLCDTFTLKGYVVLVTQKHFLSKRCDTYFGFVPKRNIKSDTFFRSLAVRSNGHSLLLNLSKMGKDYLCQKMDFAILPWNGNSLDLIYQNRDSVSNSDSLMQSIGDCALFLPSISSYGISKKQSNICKPLYSITSVTMPEFN